MFLGTVVYAVINSVILLMLALGFNLTFGISGVANFAYGALYILSAYLSWMLLNAMGIPYLVSSVLSIVITMTFGAVMYRLVLLRVRGQVLSEVIATFGIGLAILELFRSLGLVGFEYTLPVFYDHSFIIAGTYVDFQRIAILGFSVLLIAGLWLFTRYTRIGLAIRAVAQDRKPSCAVSASVGEPRPRAWLRAARRSRARRRCRRAAV